VALIHQDKCPARSPVSSYIDRYSGQPCQTARARRQTNNEMPQSRSAAADHQAAGVLRLRWPAEFRAVAYVFVPATLLVATYPETARLAPWAEDGDGAGATGRLCCCSRCRFILAARRDCDCAPGAGVRFFCA